MSPQTMRLTVRQARPEEAGAVKELYRRLIDEMAGAPYFPPWEMGVYPREEYLENAVAAGQMYLAEADGKTAGAMILNSRPSDGYEKARWGVTAAEGDVTVIHTLCVLPGYANRGVGTFMVKWALEAAKSAGKKAVRLDVLVGNLPAEKLYRGAGFRFAERVKLFYENTGLCDFDLYEYAL